MSQTKLYTTTGYLTKCNVHNKRGFVTKALAKKYGKRRRSQNGIDFYVYRCPHCQLFHIATDRT